MDLNITIVLADDSRRILRAVPGQTLLDVLRQHKIDEIEGACDGAMACSTCHIIIERGWYKKLLPATADEMDILDLASGLTPTSRLACQIVVTESMDGLLIQSPHGRGSRV